MLIYFSMKVPMFFFDFCENNKFAKIWFLSYGPKT